MTQPVAAPTVRTTCPYCGVGCGVLATPDGQGGASIAGDAEHPFEAAAQHRRMTGRVGPADRGRFRTNP